MTKQLKFKGQPLFKIEDLLYFNKYGNQFAPTGQCPLCERQIKEEQLEDDLIMFLDNQVWCICRHHIQLMFDLVEGVNKEEAIKRCKKEIEEMKKYEY